MSKLCLLNFQYNISRRWPPKPKLVRWGTKDGQNSGLSPTYLPNVEEMKRVFNKFDVNKDGKISREEYQLVLKALGKQDVETEVASMFHIADSDKDGFLDFEEFMEAHNKGGGVKKIELQNAFWTFDLDRNGRISAKDLHGVLMKLGERCSLEECERMVTAVDVNGDGLVDMNEFMKMMTHTMKQA